jgi:hypothetical protein
MADVKRSFPPEFNDEFTVGVEPGNHAYVGQDVLRGLVSGIDDFIQVRQERWRQFRSLGPALLGSTGWFTDDELIAKLTELAGACVVVTKQGRTEGDLTKLQELHRANADAPGFPIRAFSELEQMRPRVDDKPELVGPGSQLDEVVLPTIRTLGFRPRTRGYVPLMHAKLALLGHLWWHDEGLLGHVEDVVGFTPKRLWVSSANFTRASRSSLEIGYWTEDPGLLKGMEGFLVKLIGASEGLDPDDECKPQLLTVEYDDEAMAEAMADMEWEARDRIFPAPGTHHGRRSTSSWREPIPGECSPMSTSILATMALPWASAIAARPFGSILASTPPQISIYTPSTGGQTAWPGW